MLLRAPPNFVHKTLASMACRLTALRETPTVSAILGNTSWYSRG
jgi:hypothetical protein